MIVIDSDAIIEFLSGREPAVTIIADAAAAGEEIATTALNMGEVLRGEKDPKAHDIAASFLASITELPIDARVAHEFARLMQGLDHDGARMPVIDGFIAAAATVNGASILTGNVTHFARVKGLAVQGLRP